MKVNLFPLKNNHLFLQFSNQTNTYFYIVSAYFCIKKTKKENTLCHFLSPCWYDETVCHFFLPQYKNIFQCVCVCRVMWDMIYNDNNNKKVKVDKNATPHTKNKTTAPNQSFKRPGNENEENKLYCSLPLLFIHKVYFPQQNHHQQQPTKLTSSIFFFCFSIDMV